MQHLQRALVKLQGWVRHEQLKVCVLFEGRDAAGKGGTIKRIVERTNPRVVRVAALGTPTEKEKSQWYFQRYVEHLPSGGEIVIFDRSWYNRAGVQHAIGFCTDDAHAEFLHSCPLFEDADPFRDRPREVLVLGERRRSRSAGQGSLRTRKRGS
jgi:polyphosphate kinase 2 (PPK2 family)